MGRRFFITLIMASIFCGLGAAQAADAVAMNAYVGFCNGQDQVVFDLARSGKIEGRMLALLTTAGLQTEKVKLAGKFHDMSRLAESDRIIAALLTVSARSQDVSRLRELIAFKSLDKRIESYRLSLEAQVDMLSGDLESAFTKVQQAIIEVESPDPAIIAQAITIQATRGVHPDSEWLRLIRSHVDALSAHDPVKPNLQAHIDLLVNGWRNKAKVIGLFRKAHELCSRDPTLALDYASVLLSSGDMTFSQKLLEKIILDYSDSYSPYVDLLLGEIYLKQEDVEKARAAIERARSASWYLDHRSKEALVSMNAQLDGLEDREVNIRWVVIGVSMLVALLTFGCWREWKKWAQR